MTTKTRPSRREIDTVPRDAEADRVVRDSMKT